MDKCFSQTNCDRCGGSLIEGRTMSMFNEECICLNCKEKETKHPDYQKAQDADIAEIKKGNYNFGGIGMKNKVFSDERIKETLAQFKQMQMEGDLKFCPRCGEQRMRDVPTHNCLSRQADVYVCEVCGAEEAIYAMNGNPLPLEYWHYTGLMEMSQAPTDHKQVD